MGPLLCSFNVAIKGLTLFFSGKLGDCLLDILPLFVRKRSEKVLSEIKGDTRSCRSRDLSGKFLKFTLQNDA